MTKKLQTLVGLLACGFLIGCAHDKDADTFTMFLGPIKCDGVTYYPVHPGSTSYGVIDYTTNQPAAEVRPFVTLVTTNAYYQINCVDGRGLARTNTLTR